MSEQEIKDLENRIEIINNNAENLKAQVGMALSYDECQTIISNALNEYDQANVPEQDSKADLFQDVNNRTFIVTIECGEDTKDWKIIAPNKLAAKMTASANYNQKRFKILRCAECGC